jgi:hypothetical protein
LGSTASITIDYNNNPFAFASGDMGSVSTSSAYDFTDNPRVACVSCHRAHASDQPDLLRFDYTAQTAGEGSSTIGCLGCHVGQR